MSTLFEPIELTPALRLPNRIVMLPLTRARAEIDGTPNELMARYYSQRAGAGLIITEATAVSETGRPFFNSPGMFTHEHAVAWREVTRAVHRAGGRILLQINHSGRVNNLQHLKRPLDAIAPSPVAISRSSRNITINIPRVTPYAVPRQLPADEVPLVVADFRRAAELAMWAEFDGVQVHADSGYLIHQFLSTNVNLRTDEYGGSRENRARFAFEVLDAVVGAVGAERVAIKLTPGSPVQDIEEHDAPALYEHVIGQLNQRPGLAFLHLFFRDLAVSELFPPIRALFTGRTLVEGSLAASESARLIAEGLTDLAGFGRAYISNPDLADRLRQDLPLSSADPYTTYTLGPVGYVDYPAWNPSDPEGSIVRSEHSLMTIGDTVAKRG